MVLGTGGPRRKPPLHVIPMALALVAAAFLGAAIGLIWQSSGYGEAADGASEAAGGAETGAGEDAEQDETDEDAADEDDTQTV